MQPGFRLPLRHDHQRHVRGALQSHQIRNEQGQPEVRTVHMRKVRDRLALINHTLRHNNDERARAMLPEN